MQIVEPMMALTTRESQNLLEGNLIRIIDIKKISCKIEEN